MTPDDRPEDLVEGLCADLELVDTLARAQLLARRRGCEIKLCPNERLAALVELLGLAGVFPFDDGSDDEGR